MIASRVWDSSDGAASPVISRRLGQEIVVSTGLPLNVSGTRFVRTR